MSETKIPFGIDGKQGTPNLVQLSATYHQEADSNGEEDQTLVISTQESMGNPYFIIQTERWALDNVDELIAILNDFKNRL